MRKGNYISTQFFVIFAPTPIFSAALVLPYAKWWEITKLRKNILECE